MQIIFIRFYLFVFFFTYLSFQIISLSNFIYFSYICYNFSDVPGFFRMFQGALCS